MDDSGSPGAPGGPRAHLAGSRRLERALRQAGIRDAEPGAGLVFDGSDADVAGTAALEDLLADAFSVTQAAVASRAPVVYVVDGPSLYGHAAPLRAALATALLGGARSVAAEGVRHATPAHVVSLDSGPEQEDAAARAIAWLLSEPALTGQVVHCGAVHVGRPAA